MFYFIPPPARERALRVFLWGRVVVCCSYVVGNKKNWPVGVRGHQPADSSDFTLLKFLLSILCIGHMNARLTDVYNTIPVSKLKIKPDSVSRHFLLYLVWPLITR